MLLRFSTIACSRPVLWGYSLAKVVFSNSRWTSAGMFKERDCFSLVFLSKRFSGSVLSRNKVLELSEDQQYNFQESRKKRTKKSEDRNSPLSKEIRDYLSSKESLLGVGDKMPRAFLKRKKIPEVMYLVDEDVAKEFVKTVTSVWNLESDHVVLEGNPGLGLISKQLCKAGVKRLLLYESCNEFQPVLSELQGRYPHTVEITYKDIFSVWKLAFLDKMDHGSRVAEILSQLPQREWTEDPAVKMVGALSTLKFVNHLIRSITFQTGILMHGRPEMYLALPSHLYIHLTCGREAGFRLYRSNTVIFQLFFETELLTKLPRKAYFPWDTESASEKSHKTRQAVEMDSDHIYVVRVIPRKDLYDNVPRENLQPLWYFIRHHFLKRTNRIIPELERWIPGCGSRLILQGMNIFTQFGDLTPQEVLKLFQDFSSWPEYSHSPFLASMETMFLKMEQPGEDADKDIAEVDIDSLQEDGPTSTHQSLEK